MRICFFILNSFDYDSRARFICEDILTAGWQLDIIATVGGGPGSFKGATIHRLPQPVRPFRQRRFIEFNLRAASLARSLHADIYHAVDLDTLWAAVKAGQAVNSPVVYEARELYPELLSLYRRPLVKAFWQALEKKLIKKAAATVTVNDSIAAELARRYDIRRPLVIRNVPRRSVPTKTVDFRRQFGIRAKYILLYQGILRLGQGILRAIDAVAGLPETALVIVGEGPLRPQIENRIAGLDITERVKCIGRVPPAQLAEYTAGADAGFLLMEPVAMNNFLALPQKLFQYIAAETPPVITDLPELKKVVAKDSLGLVLDRNSPADDRQLIADFLENRLDTARQACRKAKVLYYWEDEGKKLTRLYNSLFG